jgi:hypothetical protein
MRRAELLPSEFGDADVWRAAHRAVRETMAASVRTEVVRRAG